MKAQVLGQRLKELTGAASYTEALEVVEQALAPRPPQPPKGVVITIDPNESNLYWSTLIGRPFTLANLLALQAACRDFARLLDDDVRAMIERVAETRVRADVEGSTAPDAKKAGSSPASQVRILRSSVAKLLYHTTSSFA